MLPLKVKLWGIKWPITWNSMNEKINYCWVGKIFQVVVQNKRKNGWIKLVNSTCKCWTESQEISVSVLKDSYFFHILA